MASIAEIARKAEVSLSTVSRVLNNRQHIHPETRQRVVHAADQLGHKIRPQHKVAPAVRVHRLAFLYTSDVACHQFMSGYCHQLIAGVRAELGELYPLTLLRGLDHVDHDQMFRRHLEARDFDGFMVFGLDKFGDYTARVRESGLPMVVFNRVAPHGEYGSVTVDFYGGARKVIEHVAKLGHRRLAVLWADNEPPAWSAIQAREALTDASRSLPCQVVPIALPRPQTPDDLRGFCERALAQQATALFTSDRYAGPCADVLEAMGVRVPEDVSVVGTGDLGFKTQRGQDLTTVGYDKQCMGRMAARMLQQIIESAGKFRWMVNGVDTYLCPGQTCGPVKQ